MQLVGANNMGVEVNAFLVSYPGAEGRTCCLLGICDTGRRVHHAPAQVEGEQMDGGDGQQGPQSSSSTSSSSIEHNLGDPAEGEVCMLFSSWRVIAGSKQLGNLNNASVDLLLNELVMEYMLQRRSHTMWIQDFLTEIMECASDVLVAGPYVIRFHMAYSGVYSSLAPAEGCRDRPAAIINNIRCMNFNR